MLLAGALADSLGLLIVFGLVFPLIAQGLIAFAIVQAIGERRQNEEYRDASTRNRSTL